MRNKVFLETDEYDIFMFPVPDGVLKGKKLFCTLFPHRSVKQWVLSWMEKLHPCFDGRFLSDIQFYREKGQVMALVTVAEKLHVARHLEKKRSAVFVRRPYKRRVFAARSPVWKLLVAPALSFAVGLAVLSGFTGHGGSVETLPTAAAVAADIASGVETDNNSDETENFSVSEVSDEVSCANTQDARPNVMEKNAFCEPVGTPESHVIVEKPAKPEKVQSILDSAEQPDFAKSDETSEETTEEPEFIELTESEEPSEPTLSEPPLLDDFIAFILGTGGRVTNFRWQSSPEVSAVIALEGCFPEDVYACVEKLCAENLCGGESDDFAEKAVFPVLSFSSISYRENIPSFSLTIDYSGFELTKYGQTDLFPAVSATDVPVAPIQAVFRRLILETGGTVASESVSPPFISGYLSESVWNDFSSRVAESFSDGVSCGISNVIFDIPQGADSVFVRAEFDREKPSFFPLESISALSPQKKDEKTTLVQEQSASTVPVKLTPLPDAEEIGSVCMEDGSFISFYRCLDGKIIKGEPYEK